MPYADPNYCWRAPRNWTTFYPCASGMCLQQLQGTEEPHWRVACVRAADARADLCRSAFCCCLEPACLIVALHLWCLMRLPLRFSSIACDRQNKRSREGHTGVLCAECMIPGYRNTPVRGKKHKALPFCLLACTPPRARHLGVSTSPDSPTPTLPGFFTPQGQFCHPCLSGSDWDSVSQPHKAGIIIGASLLAAVIAGYLMLPAVPDTRRAMLERLSAAIMRARAELRRRRKARRGELPPAETAGGGALMEAPLGGGGHGHGHGHRHGHGGHARGGQSSAHHRRAARDHHRRASAAHHTRRGSNGAANASTAGGAGVTQADLEAGGASPSSPLSGGNSAVVVPTSTLHSVDSHLVLAGAGRDGDAGGGGAAGGGSAEAGAQTLWGRISRGGAALSGVRRWSQPRAWTGRHSVNTDATGTGRRRDQRSPPHVPGY